MSMVYAVCFSRCKWWRVGTLLGPGLSCLAATAASPYMRSGGPHQNASCTRRSPGETRPKPETRRPYASKEENGGVPRIAVRDVAGDNSCFLHRGYASTRISAPAGTTPVST